MWVAFAVCSAKATHIFSAKNIRILYIESAKTVYEMALNEFVKLTMLWTTGPKCFSYQNFSQKKKKKKKALTFHANCPKKKKRLWHFMQIVWRQFAWYAKAYFLGKIRKIQSTLVISNTKGLSKILRDICTWIYQTCSIEEKINRTTTFHKWICYLIPEVGDTMKILRMRGQIAPQEQLLLFSIIFWYLLLDFHVLTTTRFFTSK